MTHHNEGVPIADTDRIVVPPLEGFVMNRVLGTAKHYPAGIIFLDWDQGGMPLHWPSRKVVLGGR